MINNIGIFPHRRMRRLRTDPFIRNIVQEHHLTNSDLIYPLFIINKDSIMEPIASMPGQHRLGFEQLLKTCEECQKLSIPAVALFPVIEGHNKSVDASESYNPNGLIPKAIKIIKKEFPDLGVITDIALDPYTTHGQDGLIDEHGYILNDKTITVLKQQALSHAESGADIVAPSDMMDGRIGAIRKILDENSYINVKILAYAAKFNSSFYGPFRDAIGSAANLGKGTKSTYQINPCNTEEALIEVALDIQEGADMVMVKPGLPYLDIVKMVKDSFHIPTLAYQVSGEYSMIKAASNQGWIDEQACVLESLISFKRAGCSAVLSYFALDAAKWLKV